MPTFQYEALDQAGKVVKNVLDAPDSHEAVARIKNQGYFPTSVKEKRTAGSKSAAAKKSSAGKKKGEFSLSVGGVKKKVLTLFTRQLSTLQDAGLPILRSLQILQEQQKPSKLKNVLLDVQNEVEGGNSLSESMARHPKVFDRLYTKMIAAGEVGGVLDVILRRLAEFMEKAERLKRRIKTAMIYPVSVITIACLILLAIMVFIIPRFQEIFKDFNAELPRPTVILISIANWIAGMGPDGEFGTPDDPVLPGWLIILASPFAVWIALKLIRKSRNGRAVTDVIKLKIPVIGKLVRLNAIARFSRTLGTLIGAGVPILESMLIARDTVGNHVFEQALQKVHDSIREGESFAEPLRESKTTDAIVVNMIDVGEETGDLDKMLLKVADNYDEEVDAAVNGLVSMLEPVMVVFLGLTVGFIVVALFMPLVTLINAAASS